jgi:hypothetical protein
MLYEVFEQGLALLAALEVRTVQDLIQHLADSERSRGLLCEIRYCHHVAAWMYKYCTLSLSSWQVFKNNGLGNNLVTQRSVLRIEPCSTLRNQS